MWFPVALVAALFQSFLIPITKYQVTNIPPAVVLFLNQLASIVFMFCVVLMLGGVPHVTTKFFIFMFCASLLDTAAFAATYVAVKRAPVSLLSPLESLVPVSALIFGAIFLHEIPTFIKFTGVIVIVIGLYFLNASSISGGIFKPFQTLFSQSGARLYFIRVVLFGLTPIFQKQAIFEITPSMPLFASFIGNIFVTLYTGLFAWKLIQNNHTAVTKGTWFFILFGICNTFGQIAVYYVFSTTYVAYATAIFSLSSLFTIILGKILFKELHIKERLFGAAVMIGGVILLAL